MKIFIMCTLFGSVKEVNEATTSTDGRAVFMDNTPMIETDSPLLGNAEVEPSAPGSKLVDTLGGRRGERRNSVEGRGRGMAVGNGREKMRMGKKCVMEEERHRSLCMWHDTILIRSPEVINVAEDKAGGKGENLTLTA